MLITHGEVGQVYNVGSGESHAIQEVLDILLAMSRVPIEIRQDPDRMRPSDVPDVVCNATRIQEQTGWQTRIPFERSLQDILDYWREETKAQLS
jgi:GDP-4-dehydro-6-deoxy-D-mannose reductase